MKSKTSNSRTEPSSSDQFPAGQERAGYVKPPADAADPIDEAAQESFPASDPPAFTGATATPSEKAISPDHRGESKTCNSTSCREE